MQSEPNTAGNLVDEIDNPEEIATEIALLGKATIPSPLLKKDYAAL